MFGLAPWPRAPRIAAPVVLLILVAFAISPYAPHREKGGNGYAQTSDEKPEQRIAEYTKWLTMFTAVLAGVGAFQIWLLISGEKLTRQSADAATKAAAAAMIQASAMVRLERPHVFATKVRVETAGPSEGGPEHREGAFMVIVDFFNYGRSPAIVDEIRTGYLVDSDIPTEPTYTRHRPDVLFERPIIPAKESYQHVCDDTIILVGPGQPDEIQRGVRNLWVFGVIRYSDAAGGVGEHGFLTCYFPEWKLEGRRVSQGRFRAFREDQYAKYSFDRYQTATTNDAT